MDRVRWSVPLNALRAFESAARHLSLKAAAFELGVTPSAISHQLRIVEDTLGLELIRRAGSGLELTEAGRALAPKLTHGFTSIREAVEDLRAERKGGPLRLSMLPTFAVHWLSPRLAMYPFERTGFELLISTTQKAVDVLAGEADAAIRHGTGEWPGLAADFLFSESSGLLAHPDFAASYDLVYRLKKTNLFISQHRRHLFERWNETLPGGPIQVGATTVVDSAGLGIRAAIDGAGVTFAGLELAQGDIDRGRLAPLFESHRVATGGAYYLVYSHALATDRRIRNLRRWLLDQVGGTAND